MKTSPSRKASMPRSLIVASMGKPRWPWKTGRPIPCAIICTSGSKIAQPKSRLSLMMWLYAVLIMVIRMRSAAALSAARITSTVVGSTRTSVATVLIARSPCLSATLTPTLSHGRGSLEPPSRPTLLDPLPRRGGEGKVRGLSILPPLPAHPHDQAAVRLDGQDVAGLHQRRRPRLLDSRRPVHRMPRRQIVPLDDAVRDEGPD